jgi:hypothetical protein
MPNIELSEIDPTMDATVITPKNPPTAGRPRPRQPMRFRGSPIKAMRRNVIRSFARIISAPLLPMGDQGRKKGFATLDTKQIASCDTGEPWFPVGACPRLYG